MGDACAHLSGANNADFRDFHRGFSFASGLAQVKPIPSTGAVQAPFATARRSLMSQQSQAANSNPLALWMLMFGNFIIGTGILLPAGLLNDLMAAFSISASRAGLLMFVGGLVVGIGAPLFAASTSRIERRHLLTGSLILYGAGHLGAALAPQFEMQVLLRALTVVGAAIFTPQAASTVGLLVPLEKRASAIAFIFIGWSAASVAGIPLGTLLADMLGWRMVYGLMAVLCLLAAAGVWLSLKPGLFVTPLSLAAWKEAFSTPIMWLVYAVTLLSMSGQFSMFGYIAPILKQGFGATSQMISAMFAVVGIAGVVGNTLASRIVARFGIDQVIAIGLASLCIGFFGFALSWGSYFAAAFAAIFWGLGSFSSNSLQQSRLVALAPHLAAATVALNTSVVYLGQSIGSATGGRLVDSGMMTATPYVALGFMGAALLLSLLAQRLTARQRVLAS
jgi:MFS transporter, DHA1 family, inner membrane transport protein